MGEPYRGGGGHVWDSDIPEPWDNGKGLPPAQRSALVAMALRSGEGGEVAPWILVARTAEGTRHALIRRGLIEADGFWLRLTKAGWLHAQQYQEVINYLSNRCKCGRRTLRDNETMCAVCARRGQ